MNIEVYQDMISIIIHEESKTMFLILKRAVKEAVVGVIKEVGDKTFSKLELSCNNFFEIT